MNPPRRVLDLTEPGPNGCLNYTGFINATGYGRVGRGKTTLAHRVAWEQEVGPIPEGKFVRHHCDNPRCVNPKHLFVGTHLDNMRDKVSKGRSASLPGERHPSAKLTAADVLAIRQSSLSSRQLADIYGISPSRARTIKRGQGWACLRRPDAWAGNWAKATEATEHLNG